MPQTIVLGAGPCGLAAAMMLARDGHRVTVLERDPAPVPDHATAAWEGWERAGVAQFRQAHFLQGRSRQVLAAHLPDVLAALEAAGALRLDPLARLPEAIADREPRPGDERFVTTTARRPVLEQVFARAAEEQPGLEVRRGVAVAALETRRAGGRLQVTGVRDESGRLLPADLIVDVMGRRSVLPALLAGAGGDPVHEESEDSGFLYYTRFFRSAGGRLPATRAPALSHLGSFSVLTLPADSGHWSVTLYGASGDRPLKRLRDEACWTALVRACPLHAHWLDGEPMTPVMPMGGAVDRYRRYRGTAGVVSVGDAWACTNPSLGRGISLGLLHASLLRDVVREHPDDPAALVDAFDEVTERELTPWYRATVAFDRSRLAQIDAIRAGEQPPAPAPDDVAGRVRAALPVAMGRDPDVFRAGLEISNCLALPEEVFSRPGMAQRVLDVAGDDVAQLPGPERAEVLELVA